MVSKDGRARVALAVFFVVAGLSHFFLPEVYVAAIPSYLPDPRRLNGICGGAEILGGLGVLVPRLRRLAGIGLVLLLVAVLPAHVHVLRHGWAGVDLPQWLLWVRLPFQLVFLAWVWWVCLRRPDRSR